ncbi:hypothetical protein MHU86_17399 [Fragilaria crotonensis]|nr:hypothetical protein MHU86_17399 [Fragilaria crotonensis]
MFSEDLAPLFGMEISEPTIEKPDDPGPNPTETDKLIWQEEVKEYVKRTRTLKGNLANVHAVIWSQSSEAMRSKIKALVEYEQRAKANDCTWMLQQIKATTMQFDANAILSCPFLMPEPDFSPANRNSTNRPTNILSDSKALPTL